MEHFRNFFGGMGGILRSAGRREYPPYRGFEHDAKQMYGDWVRVGADLRATLKKEPASRQRSRAKNG